MRLLSLARVSKLVFGLVLSLNIAVSHAAVWNIKYPRALNEGDLRNDYPIALLALALDKTGVRYQIMPSDRIMLQGKALRQLRENRSVNVVWSMTDEQREKDLIPIRIPIFKGLIGLRVFLIHRDKQQAFSAISSFAELQKYIPVQGEDWPDTKILQSNGFDVETATEYLDNFAMLSRFQADFFPRSVVEVANELEMPSLDPDIVLENTLAIQYPSAMYFFVNRSNPTLAKLLETGLQRALDDGSYDALFQQHYQTLVETFNLHERTIFRLDNPLLSEETPLDNTSLWIDVTTEE
ncbi:amino acid ABC transporter substrate-binding protein [Alteromonas facilis]|uniref:amino acid ABC transporter substrate-binding protein n=1 Tax=Alteromonas facilis TaxID=2048004 RepID=UPI000C2944D2|nr:amino acid ABC transporter substrate-binding protein [Alteromonas facilis]